MKNKILFGLILVLMAFPLIVQARAEVCANTLSGWTLTAPHQECTNITRGNYTSNITLCKTYLETWTPTFEQTCLDKRQSSIFLSSQDKFIQQTTKCEVDSDCTTSRQSLCPCNAGGREVAVNKIGKSIYDFMWLSSPQSWAISPYNLMCIQVMNCLPSKCIDERCQLVPYY